MENKRDENLDEKIDDEDLDITKDAFFSDLVEMEDEITSEAYELVEHAMDLINTRYYDDGIEILRQALGLYTQINKQDEIKAIKDKISEIYILKEKIFREDEEVEVKETEVPEVVEENNMIEDTELIKEIESHEETKNAMDLISLADQLIVQAHQLANNNKFEDALNKYDEAENILEELGKDDEIKRLYELIEECYNKKAEYLRSIKKEMESSEEYQTVLNEEQLKEKKLEQYLETKKHEEDISSRAYKILDDAVDLAKDHQYDQALTLYEEGANLFKELNWTYEFKKIQDTIEQIKTEKITYLQSIERKKVKIEKEIEKEIQIDKVTEQQVKELEEQEKFEQMQRLRGLELQKMEQEFFKAQIDNMATEAAKITREYELEMQKSIKKGTLVEECIYPKVIEIYKRIKELLLEKGWNSEAEIYDNTINVYIQKFKQDQKIRQIEAEKIEKRKEAEELIKFKKREPSTDLDLDQQKKLEEQKKIEKEKKEFEETIDTMIKRAEKMAREYDVAMKKAIKKGKLANDPPFLKIIKIYEKVREMLLEKGNNKEAAVYSNQIAFYNQRLKKDNKLREVEAQKAQREKELEEIRKIRKKDGMEEVRIKALENKEEEKFEKLIVENVNKAEKMVRDFEIAQRKAYRKGAVLEETPYSEIIEIYENLREKVHARGWKEQSEIYANQIKIYQEKLEKHEKLLEVEAQKAQREKELEEMHKIGKVEEIDQKKLDVIKKKEEEKEFQNYIMEMVNKAEKREREFDLAMKKAIKEGGVLKETPYSEIIEIYENLREKVYARGWREQSEIYANQIKIYQEKLEKHEKLMEIEAQKAQREKELEEMHKIEKVEEPDQKKLDIIKKKEEEKEFQNYIMEMVNKAEKREREFDLAMKKAIKEGGVLKETPYSEIIEIYENLREKVYARGWREQLEIYANQIKIYQEKLEKHEKLMEIEAQKAQREKELEELKKIDKSEIKPAKPDKIKELETEFKEEDIILDKAMNLIDDTEKAVKKYELSIKKDILVYESPYNKAISNYEEARELFTKIGWRDEANRLNKTINFYKDKKEKDEKLRKIEQEKLEQPKIDLELFKADTKKEFLERQKRLSEFEEKRNKADETAERIFKMIQDAERMAQEYEIKLKAGIFDYEAPYEKIIEIYRKARKRFEEIDWKEESAKLIDTINYYKEKLEQDKKFRALEIEKVKKREEELVIQQRLLEKARIEQEKLLQQKKQNLDLRKERVAQFETQKDKAFRLMDQAKRELRQENFEKAIEFYKESEKIFIDIKWEEGINMVRDSVVMINNKKKAFELEQKALEDKKAQKKQMEELLEKKMIETELIKKQQQEEKRKEILKIQTEKEQERQTSEEAYELLEEGTALMNDGKFTQAYEKYITARDLFQKIFWQREVSRINNELLFKLKREQKQAELFEEIKTKKIEEEKQIALLQEDAKKERKKLEKQKKDERKEAAKRELDKKISIKLNNAYKLLDSLKYNEGILILREEVQKLKKLEKHDEIERIYEKINNYKSISEIPLITIDVDIEESKNGIFIAAYKALDEAQISANNNQFMKVISELNEAKFKLEELNLGKEIVKEIDNKIKEFRSKVSKKPLRESTKAGQEPIEDEMEILRRRIAARREERRKKVLDLLGKREK